MGTSFSEKKRENLIWAKGPNDIPNEEHFAIINLGRYSETSYGQTTQCTYPEYVIYPDRESWERGIKASALRKHSYEDFKAIHVIPAKIETTIQVNVKEPSL